MANPNPCTATKDGNVAGTQYRCRKKADHVLKAGRYARQHMDTKNYPPLYWDATPEEIAKLRDS